MVGLAATVSDSTDAHLTIEAATAPEVRGHVERALLRASMMGLAASQVVSVEIPEDELERVVNAMRKSLLKGKRVAVRRFVEK